MVRHNNMIPNEHFHKKWQRLCRVKFGQPMRKRSRYLTRSRKMLARAPRPVDLLRPIVQCPSFRYHTKQRIGRGFTLQEVKIAGISPKYARSVGICVEYRRKSKSAETLLRNVQRLKEYLGKLIVFPKGGKKEREEVGEFVVKNLNEVKKSEGKVKARVVGEEEKKFEAYNTLRKARTQKKSISRKLKRKKKTDTMDMDEFRK